MQDSFSVRLLVGLLNTRYILSEKKHQDLIFLRICVLLFISSETQQKEAPFLLRTSCRRKILTAESKPCFLAALVQQVYSG